MAKHNRKILSLVLSFVMLFSNIAPVIASDITDNVPVITEPEAGQIQVDSSMPVGKDMQQTVAILKNGKEVNRMIKELSGNGKIGSIKWAAAADKDAVNIAETGSVFAWYDGADDTDGIIISGDAPVLDDAQVGEIIRDTVLESDLSNNSSEIEWDITNTGESISLTGETDAGLSVISISGKGESETPGTLYLFSDADTIQYGEDASDMFRELPYLEDISGLKEIDFSNVKNASCMFAGDTILSDITPIMGYKASGTVTTDILMATSVPTEKYPEWAVNGDTYLSNEEQSIHDNEIDVTGNDVIEDISNEEMSVSDVESAAESAVDGTDELSEDTESVTEDIAESVASELDTVEDEEHENNEENDVESSEDNSDIDSVTENPNEESENGVMSDSENIQSIDDDSSDEVSQAEEVVDSTLTTADEQTEAPASEETPGVHDGQFYEIIEEKNDADALSMYDFSSMRLIVASDKDIIEEVDKPYLISSYGGMYLLQYNDIEDAKEAFIHYSKVAEFVEIDEAVHGAEEIASVPEQVEESDISENSGDNSVSDVSELNIVDSDTLTDSEDSSVTEDSSINVDENANELLTEETALDVEEEETSEKETEADVLHYEAEEAVYTVPSVDPFGELEEALAEKTDAEERVIALIDTGASEREGVVERISVIGDDPSDDNGHGDEMVGYILEEEPTAKILSIKALDYNATGSVSTVYAAIRYAIERGADIINLSLYGYSTQENSILADIIREAVSLGITVVGAAGNDGRNVKYYIPGNIDEAVIVGASDAYGRKLLNSNYGETVDYYVNAGSTSEAAAKMSARIYADKLDAEDVFISDFSADYKGELRNVYTFVKASSPDVEHVENVVGQLKWDVPYKQEDGMLTAQVNAHPEDVAIEEVNGVVVFINWMDIGKTERNITEECAYDAETGIVSIPEEYIGENITVVSVLKDDTAPSVMLPGVNEDGEFYAAQQGHPTTWPASWGAPPSPKYYSCNVQEANGDYDIFSKPVGTTFTIKSGTTRYINESEFSGRYAPWASEGWGFASTLTDVRDSSNKRVDVFQNLDEFYGYCVDPNNKMAGSPTVNGGTIRITSKGDSFSVHPGKAYVVCWVGIEDYNSQNCGDYVILYKDNVGKLRIKKKSLNANVSNTAHYNYKATFDVYNSKNKKVATLTTDAKTGVSKWTGELHAGKYTIKEVSAPAGFDINTEAVKVTVTSGKKQTVDFYNNPELHTSVKVVKKDAATGQVLTGATFVVEAYSSGTWKVLDTLNDSNSYTSREIYEKESTDKRFRVRETVAPPYYTGLFSQEFQIDLKDKKPYQRKYEVPNDSSVDLYVVKVDKNNHTHYLSGASFTVYEYVAATGSYAATGINMQEMTDTANKPVYKASLKATVSNKGKFKIVETAAPAGFKLDSSEKYFQVTNKTPHVSAGEIKATDLNCVMFEDMPLVPRGIVDLEKRDAETHEKVGDGGIFKVYQWNDDKKEYEQSAIDTLTYSSATGMYSSRELALYWRDVSENQPLYNQGKFLLTEEKNPPGYVMKNDVVTGTNASGQEWTRYGIEFLINNKDKERVDAVHLSLTKDNTENAYEIIKVTSDETTRTAAKFRIWKDGADAALILNGASATITSSGAEYNTVDGLISLRRIPDGVYHYKETESIDKRYHVNDTVYSFIVKNGHVNGQDKVSVKVINTVFDYLYILKKDADTGTADGENYFPEGTEFTVHKGDGNNNYEANAFKKLVWSNTIADPRTGTPGVFIDEEKRAVAELEYTKETKGQYQIVEVKATPGYILDPTPQFITVPEVLNEGEENIVELEFVNKPNEFKLRKVDTKGNPLEGVQFSYGRENDEEHSYVSDGDGWIKIKALASGRWHFRETNTLAGYKLDPTIHYFTVREDGYIVLEDGTVGDKVSVEMENKEAVKVRLKKVDTATHLESEKESGFPKGTTFAIYQWNKETESYCDEVYKYITYMDDDEIAAFPHTGKIAHFPKTATTVSGKELRIQWKEDFTDSLTASNLDVTYYFDTNYFEIRISMPSGHLGDYKYWSHFKHLGSNNAPSNSPFTVIAQSSNLNNDTYWQRYSYPSGTTGSTEAGRNKIISLVETNNVEPSGNTGAGSPVIEIGVRTRYQYFNDAGSTVYTDPWWYGKDDEQPKVRAGITKQPTTSNEYTISYNANGGSGAPGNQYTTKTTFYTFAGWLGNNDYTYNQGDSAVYYGMNFTATYNTSSVSNKSVTLSNTRPTLSGRTFLGWSTSSTATTASYQPGQTYNFSSNTTLYAVWQAVAYTLKMDPNGGKYKNSTDVVQISTPEYPLMVGSGNWGYIGSFIPKKRGYTLRGFYSAATGGTKIYNADGTAVNEGEYWSGNVYRKGGDLTVYAQYDVNIYTVTIDANGGQVPEGGYGGVLTGTNSTATYTIEDVRDGDMVFRNPVWPDGKYVFSGWKYIEPERFHTYANAMIERDGIGNRHYQAQWMRNGNFVDNETAQLAEIAETDMNEGKFKIRELTATPGYIINEPREREFSIDDAVEEAGTGWKVINLEFENTPNKTIIQKVDVSGNRVADLVFDVWYEEETGSMKHPATDQNGEIELMRLKPGTWHYRENAASATAHGFRPNTNIYDIVVLDIDGSSVIQSGENTTNVVYNTDSGDNLFTVKKVDKFGGPVANVAFEFTFPAGVTSVERVGGGVVTATTYTDTNGNIAMHHIPDGTYTFRESSTQPYLESGRYILDTNTYSFTVSGGQVVGDSVICVKNDENHIEIKKIDAETNEPLANAEFHIWSDNGADMTKKTDANGIIEIFHATAGTWHYQETKAPDGYIIVDGSVHDFVVADNGLVDGEKEVSYTVTNRKSNVEFLKVDEEGNPIANVTFSIQNEDLGYHESFTTGDDGKFEIKGLIPGRYSIVETDAPEGYVSDRRGYFRLDRNYDIYVESGLTTGTTFATDVTGSTYTVSSDTGTYLATDFILNSSPTLTRDGDKIYATYNVSTNNGYEFAVNPFDEKTADEKTITIPISNTGEGGTGTGLLYIGRNSSDGYVNDVVQLNVDVTYTVREVSVLTITLENKENGMEFLKVDESGCPIPGVRINVSAPSSELSGEYVTNDDGKLEFNGQTVVKKLPAGEYTFTEVSTGEEYELDTRPRSFSVGTDGVPVSNDPDVSINSGRVTIRMVNKYKPKYEIFVEKRDANTNDVLTDEGFVFEILEWDGQEYVSFPIGDEEKCVSRFDETRKLYIFGPDNEKYLMQTDRNEGKFKVREIAAPAGYDVDWEREFTIQEINENNNQNNVFVVTASDSTNEITIRKIDRDGNTIPGVQFEIWHENDAHEILESTEGVSTKDKLEDGTWHFMEVAESAAELGFVPDYDKDGVMHEYDFVVRDGKINGQTDREDFQIVQEYNVTDYEYIYADFVIEKIDEERNAVMSDVEFEISEYDKENNTYGDAVTSMEFDEDTQLYKTKNSVDMTDNNLAKFMISETATASGKTPDYRAVVQADWTKSEDYVTTATLYTVQGEEIGTQEVNVRVEKVNEKIHHIFDLTGDGKLKNKDNHLTIKKVDPEGNVLEGAEFELSEIYDFGVQPDTPDEGDGAVLEHEDSEGEEPVPDYVPVFEKLVTDEHGIADISHLKDAKYRLVEVSGIDGYAVDNHEWTVVVDNGFLYLEGDEEHRSRELTVVAVNKPNLLRVIKKQRQNGAYVAKSGVDFEIKRFESFEDDPAGTALEVRTGTTDVNGLLEFPKLYDGVWYLRETNGSNEINNVYRVFVVSNGTIYDKMWNRVNSVVEFDDPIWNGDGFDVNIRIEKVNAGDETQKVTGATFTVYENDPASVSYPGEERVVLEIKDDDGDGVYTGTVHATEENQGIFYIKETTAPRHYFGDWDAWIYGYQKTDWNFLVDTENAVYEEEHDWILIRKVDEYTDEPLEDCVIEYYCDADTEPETATTGDVTLPTGEVVKGAILILDPYHDTTYHFKEIKEPDGYIRDEKEFEIYVDSNGLMSGVPHFDYRFGNTRRHRIWLYTGGIGRTGLYITGSIMAVCMACLYLFWKKKRKKVS